MAAHPAAILVLAHTYIRTVEAQDFATPSRRITRMVNISKCKSK
jgi:hypothetical protein